MALEHAARGEHLDPAHDPREMGVDERHQGRCRLGRDVLDEGARAAGDGDEPALRQGLKTGACLDDVPGFGQVLGP